MGSSYMGEVAERLKATVCEDSYAVRTASEVRILPLSANLKCAIPGAPRM